MKTEKMILENILESVNKKKNDDLDLWFLAITVALFFIWICNSTAHAGSVHLPGNDVADKLEAAGTLMRLIDSVLFSWGARIFAGIAVLSAGWNFKEQRIGIALLCVVAAIVLGTAPTWVKNIFEIGGGGTIFSFQNTLISEVYHA